MAAGERRAEFLRRHSLGHVIKVWLGVVGEGCAPGFRNDRDGERTVSKYVKRGFGGTLAEEDITEVTDTLRGTFFNTAVPDVERVVAH